MRLLRMVLLRDAIREIHSQRSVMLAKGDSREAKDLQSLEKSIDDRVGGYYEVETFESFLALPPPGRSPSAALSADFLHVFGEERFHRMDRKWEREMASEACALGWNFWALDAWIEIPKVEAFHNEATSRSWPKGISLIVEGVPSASPHLPDRAIWKGRWFWAFHPSYDPVALDLLKWGKSHGILSDPDRPGWKRLFPL